ncbi:chymotrypsin-1-like [Amblyomma americanum]
MELYFNSCGKSFFLVVELLLLRSITEAQSNKINAPDCGISQPLGRIINGSTISKTQVPWLVQVVTISLRGNVSYCGGSILNRNVILTAAHCVMNRSMFDNWKILVHYNTTNLFRGPMIEVKRGIVHKRFERAVKGYDIALLELNKPLPNFDNFVRPVCLPRQGAKTPQVKMLLAGYGAIDFQQNLPKKVLYLVTTTVPMKACCASFGWCYCHLTPIAFCTNNLRGTAYKGDSGSPLTAYIRRGKATKAVQLGIVSFGNKRNPSGLVPNVFTRVSKYIKWVNKALKTITLWKKIVV